MATEEREREREREMVVLLSVGALLALLVTCSAGVLGLCKAYGVITNYWDFLKV